MVWQPLPTKTKEGKGIIYYQAGKKPDVYGVFLVDPKTGGLGRSVFLKDIRREGVELRHIVVSEWLAAEKYRAEEKEYERELAGKEVEFEAGRIERGLPPVPLERKGAKELAEERGLPRPPSGLFEVEYGGKVYPTAVKGWKPKEYLRDIEVPRPIEPTSIEPTWLVSPGVMKLYEKRKPEIERVLEREAGLKAWKEERIRYMAEFEKRERKIEPFREIWKMKPSIKKAKLYFPALITKRKEMGIAGFELWAEAVYGKKKKEEWLLTAAVPALHPKKTALIVGAVMVPAMKVPIIGKMLATKKVAYTIGALYGLGKGAELAMKYKAEPSLYKRPSGIVRLALEPVTEIGAFMAGAATVRGMARVSKTTIKKMGVETIKLKERVVLPPKVKAKPKTLRLIRIDTTKMLKGEPAIYKEIKYQFGRKYGGIVILTPKKFVGIKKPAFKFELEPIPKVAKKPFFEIIKPPKPKVITTFDLIKGPFIITKKGKFADLFKEYKMPKGKPFEIDVTRIVTPKLELPPKPLGIKVTGLKPALKEMFELPKGKFIEVEVTKKKAIKDILKSVLVVPKGKPIEFKIVKPPKVITTFDLIKGPFYITKKGKFVDLFKLGLPKGKPFEIDVTRIITLPRPKPYYEFKFGIPKLKIDITKIERGYPFELFRQRMLKGKLLFFRYREFKPYPLRKITGIPPRKPTLLEMYWQKLIRTETGKILGIRAISYPRGLIKEYRLKKPIIPSIPIKLKAKEIWKAKPPTPLRKWEVEVGAGRQKLIQITKQITKQRLETEQVLKTEQKLKTKQVIKQKQKLILSSIQTQKQKQKQKLILISTQASKQAQATVQKLMPETKQIPLVIPVSIVSPAKDVARMLKQPTVQITEPRLEVPFPRVPPPGIIIPPKFPRARIRKLKKKKKKLKRITKYRPSLVAVYEKIIGPQPLPREMTGLKIRPIPRRRR